MGSYLPVQAFLAVFAVALASSAKSEAVYDFETYFHAFSCPISNDTAWVTITLPVESGQVQQNAKFPTVLMINGFVLRSCVYAPFAQDLATRGYAVIQYDDTKNPRSDFQSGFNDALRLQWIDEVLTCTKKAAVFASHFDFSKLAIVGHSRGGKLAGLYFAQNYGPSRPDIQTAFMIDPIDAPLNTEDKCISFYPSYDPDTYPNLAQLLQKLGPQGPPVAIIGANVTSKCNCNTSNYDEIWPAVPDDSWRIVLAQAGHLQVTDDTLQACSKESLIERWILKAVYTNPGSVPLVGKYLSQWTCTKGALGTSEAMELVSVPLIEWLNQKVKGLPPSSEYKAWVAAKVADGTITSKVKAAAGAVQDIAVDMQ